MNKKPISDFKRFVNKELNPAIKDLESLGDKNRVHVQKLVYTNLVDRFDTLVDTLLLTNCTEELLLQDATSKLTDNITESDLITLLLQSNNLQDVLENKIKEGLRNGILRERHSKKLSKLFSVFQPEENCWSLPRVNLSTGAILDKIKPQTKEQPYSICGYADWLYSRRNSIVHGAGSSKFLSNDKRQLKKLFKCTSRSGFRIQLSSVKNAVAFYENVAEVLSR
jgi:hypothetical protein